MKFLLCAFIWLVLAGIGYLAGSWMGASFNLSVWPWWARFLTGGYEFVLAIIMFLVGLSMASDD